MFGRCPFDWANPQTGRYGQVSRTVHGSKRTAQWAAAELHTEVAQNVGSSAMALWVICSTSSLSMPGREVSHVEDYRGLQPLGETGLIKLLAVVWSLLGILLAELGGLSSDTGRS